MQIHFIVPRLLASTVENNAQSTKKQPRSYSYLESERFKKTFSLLLCTQTHYRKQLVCKYTVTKGSKRPGTSEGMRCQKSYARIVSYRFTMKDPQTLCETTWVTLLIIKS